MRRLRRKQGSKEKSGVSEEVLGDRWFEKHFGYVPRTKRPVIPIHCIGEFARFGGRQCVTQEAIRVESKSVVGCPSQI